MLNNACWITSPRDAGVAVYRYQKSFALRNKPLKKATLQASAIGVYTAELNGARIGNAVLTPGWTSYKHRIQVQTYDVTGMLRAGENLLSFGIGQGWAVGCIGYGHDNHYTADHVSLIAALTLTYADGTADTVATAPGWDVLTTPVLSTDIYMGETVDLTAPVEPVGKAVQDTVKTRLIPQVGEWITEHERIGPDSCPARQPDCDASRRGAGPRRQLLQCQLPLGKERKHLHLQRRGGCLQAVLYLPGFPLHPVDRIPL